MISITKFFSLILLLTPLLAHGQPEAYLDMEPGLFPKEKIIVDGKAFEHSTWKGSYEGLAEAVQSDPEAYSEINKSDDYFLSGSIWTWGSIALLIGSAFAPDTSAFYRYGFLAGLGGIIYGGHEWSYGRHHLYRGLRSYNRSGSIKQTSVDTPSKCKLLINGFGCQF